MLLKGFFVIFGRGLKGFFVIFLKFLTVQGLSFSFYCEHSN